MKRSLTFLWIIIFLSSCVNNNASSLYINGDKLDPVDIDVELDDSIRTDLSKVIQKSLSYSSLTNEEKSLLNNYLYALDGLRRQNKSQPCRITAGTNHTGRVIRHALIMKKHQTTLSQILLAPVGIDELS